MELNASFLANSILLGAGLAMDAFSVSIANGLNEPDMKKGRRCGIAATFALFQTLMPLAGWFCVRSLATYFRVFGKFIPWIALTLLGFIGGRMMLDALKKDSENNRRESCTTFKTLMIQGFATSADALSVGFTTSSYNCPTALCSSLVIGSVTFILCMLGLTAGSRTGQKYAGRAGIFGGVILILIGIEILITSLL